ncbi:hypothetical protein DPE81_05665, partial [Salmonella enterica subsp. enterica]|nr:hypothetical protein [Salmonella enterica subsp. enterica]
NHVLTLLTSAANQSRIFHKNIFIFFLRLKEIHICEFYTFKKIIYFAHNEKGPQYRPVFLAYPKNIQMLQLISDMF